MKFFVERTSDSNREPIPPCDNATMVHIKQKHIYGHNNIYLWYIEINTLEELIEFYKKHGNIIISCRHINDNGNFELLENDLNIEIYDSYRE